MKFKRRTTVWVDTEDYEVKSISWKYSVRIRRTCQGCTAHIRGRWAHVFTSGGSKALCEACGQKAERELEYIQRRDS